MSGRTLGVAQAGAEIEEGTISGLTSLKTATGSTVGFYGVSAVTQPVGASQTAYTGTVGTAIATTVFSAAYTGMWAFSSSTVAQTYRTRINQLRVDMIANNIVTLKMRKDLKALGLIKGLA